LFRNRAPQSAKEKPATRADMQDFLVDRVPCEGFVRSQIVKQACQPRPDARRDMSGKDAISLLSRAIALYLTFWVLAELTNLPVRVLCFVHSVTAERMAPNTEYLRQYYLMELAFQLTRIVG
jgi:hypothetical protein